MIGFSRTKKGSDKLRIFHITNICVLAGVVLSIVGIRILNAETEINRKINVLLVTGYDHPAHNWKVTAPALKEVLEKDKRFKVDVVDEPNFLSSEIIYKYDVLILHFMNWEKPSPGQKARDNLIRFVSEGGGLVLVHFACGAFQDWPEFVNLAGRISDPEKRPHDPYGKFEVEIIDANHPVTKGLKSFEVEDELYTCLVGESQIKILAEARSTVDGVEYPMAFVLNYGEGRVFNSVLGHDINSINNPSVAELFRRSCAWTAGAKPVDTKRVVLIAGKKSHGPGEHEHEEGVWLLKTCLDNSPNVKGIETEVVLNGWPKEPNTLESADTIVVFSDGWEDHPLAKQDRVKKNSELLDRGKGLVLLHFAVAPPRNKEDEELFLQWMGGFYKDGYSQNPYNEPLVSPASADHPICRGVKAFTASDEFYYKLKFNENDKRVTAILTAPLPEDNPQTEILAWAVQRSNGGRSFGFTGGHYHKNWQIEQLRKTVLNAILWTAKMEVPEDGVKSTLETGK